jgi:hypothetical protein
MRFSPSIEHVEERIHLLRGCKVMMGHDLAELYCVPLKALNQAVKRNKERFPEDFMFRLTREESAGLRLQNAFLKPGRGRHRKYLPYAFTEHGAVMLSAILKSPVAVATSIQIVRAFNHLRRIALGHRELVQALEELACRVTGHDEQFKVVFAALRKLTHPPAKPRKQIGFRP